MRDGLIVQERLALIVPSRAQVQFPLFVFEKNVTALGTRQLERDVDQCDQDLVQYTDRIQFAGGLEEEG